MSGLVWKVCGITNAVDATVALDAGADALGFVFYAPSPRAVSVDDAASIVAGLEASTSKVGVFANPQPEEVQEAADRLGLDFVQLSGDEDPEMIAAAPRPAWKGLRLAPGMAIADAQRQAERFPGCTLVVDASVPGEFGGTGQCADWQAAAALARTRDVVLAGGLTADNVSEAIDAVRPWGIDVSSGVEETPGRKSADKLKAFARALEAFR